MNDQGSERCVQQLIWSESVFMPDLFFFVLAVK